VVFIARRPLAGVKLTEAQAAVDQVLRRARLLADTETPKPLQPETE
jgi:hypothetical protein